MLQIIIVISFPCFLMYRKDGRECICHMNRNQSPDRIITVNRYYISLAADPKYKRRVAWLSSATNVVGDLAVVEYFGVPVSGNPHGNTKEPSDKAPFIRTQRSQWTKSGTRSLRASHSNFTMI